MFLAIRELKQSKLRYLLVALIILLVAFLVFMISGLAQGLSADNASAIQHLKGNYFVLDSDSGHRLNRSSVPGKVTDELGKEGITAVEKLSVEMFSAKLGSKDKNVDIALFATNSDGYLVPEPAEGEPIHNKGTEILVDSSLKREGLQIGDTLKMGPEDTPFTVKGFVDGSRFSHTPVVYMDPKGFKKLEGTRAKTVSDQEPKVNTIIFQTEDSHIQALKQALSEYEIATQKDILKNLPSYSQEQASLNMMIGFLFVIAAFVLAVFFYVITLQKRNQFGVLKALGAKTSYLAANLLGQVMLVTSVCVILSIVITYGVKQILPEAMPFSLNPATVVIYSIILLAVSLAGSLLSLIQIAKVDPVEAIEGGE